MLHCKEASTKRHVSSCGSNIYVYAELLTNFFSSTAVHSRHRVVRLNELEKNNNPEQSDENFSLSTVGTTLIVLNEHDDRRNGKKGMNKTPFPKLKIHHKALTKALVFLFDRWSFIVLCHLLR